jgi:hypothetical protein
MTSLRSNVRSLDENLAMHTPSACEITTSTRKLPPVDTSRTLLAGLLFPLSDSDALAASVARLVDDLECVVGFPTSSDGSSSRVIDPRDHGDAYYHTYRERLNNKAPWRGPVG